MSACICISFSMSSILPLFCNGCMSASILSMDVANILTYICIFEKDDELGLGKVKKKNSENCMKSYWSGNELLVHAANPCNWGMTQWLSMTAKDRQLILLTCENKQII